MEENIRIMLKNVTKKFDLSLKDNKSALAKTVSFLFVKEKNDFLALNDVSFTVLAGENIGMIGSNGSGKSTLLRVIAGVYKHDKGVVQTKGEIVYLTGFGYGIKPMLTMRENIYLSGSIMGLSQEALKKRFDEIVDFSGLREYLDTKVYKFSSGMQSRLAASIGLYCIEHKNPDILLIDEVIGGGADKDFQEKALKKMEDLLKRGASVILVSHNLEAIKKYCDRVFWLENGKIVIEGKPKLVVENYLSNKRE